MPTVTVWIDSICCAVAEIESSNFQESWVSTKCHFVLWIHPPFLSFNFLCVLVSFRLSSANAVHAGFYFSCDQKSLSFRVQQNTCIFIV